MSEETNDAVIHHVRPAYPRDDITYAARFIIETDAGVDEVKLPDELGITLKGKKYKLVATPPHNAPYFETLRALRDALDPELIYGATCTLYRRHDLVLKMGLCFDLPIPKPHEDKLRGLDFWSPAIAPDQGSLEGETLVFRLEAHLMHEHPDRIAEVVRRKLAHLRIGLNTYNVRALREEQY